MKKENMSILVYQKDNFYFLDYHIVHIFHLLKKENYQYLFFFVYLLLNNEKFLYFFSL